MVAVNEITYWVMPAQSKHSIYTSWGLSVVLSPQQVAQVGL